MKRLGLVLLVMIVFVYLYSVAPESVREAIEERSTVGYDEKSEFSRSFNDDAAIAAGFKSIVLLNGDFRGFAPTPLNSITASRDGDTIQVICGRANGGDGTGFLGVYYTVSFDAGLTWSSPMLITSAGPFLRNYCEIASSAGEFPYVVAGYRTSSYLGAWFTTDILGPGQGGWTSPLLISDTLNYSAYMPSIAVNDAGDKVAFMAYDAFYGIGSNYSSDYGATWNSYSIPHALNDSVANQDVCALRWGDGDEVHAIVGMSWFNENRYDIAGSEEAFFEGYSSSSDGGQSWSDLKNLYFGDKRPSIPSINGDTFIYYVDTIKGNGHADSTAVKAYFNSSSGYWDSSDGKIDGEYWGFGTWWYWWDAEYYNENGILFYAIPMADVCVDYYIKPGGDLFTFPWQAQSIIFGFKRSYDEEFIYDYVDVHDSVIIDTTGRSATWRGNCFSANVSFDRTDGTVYIIYLDYDDTLTGNSSVDALKINNNEIYRTILALNVDAYTTEAAPYITDDGYAHILVCPMSRDSLYFKSINVRDPGLIWTYVGSSCYSSNPSDSIKPADFSIVSPIGDIPGNKPTFVWNASFDVNLMNYRLYVNNIAKSITIDTFYACPSALSDGIYSWYVISCDTCYNMTASLNVETFRVDVTPPGSPFPVSPQEDSHSASNVFVWRKAFDNLSGIKNYELMYDFDSYFSAPVTVVTADTFSAESLYEEVYYWKVRAIDNFDNVGNWSPVMSFEYDPNAPAVPLLSFPINNEQVTDSSVLFDWTSVVKKTASDGSDQNKIINATQVSYVIQVDTVKTFPTPLFTDTLIEDMKAYKITKGHRYYWRVFAFDETGNSSGWSSADSFNLDAKAPSKPTLSFPEDESSVANAVFVWNSSTDDYSGVKEYLIQYDEDSLFGSSDSCSLKDTVMMAGLSESTYYWRVMAIDSFDNRSDWSDVWSFTYSLTGISDKFALDVRGAEKTDLCVRFNEVIFSTITNDCDITLYDVSGKVLDSKTGLKGFRRNYSTENLIQGIYFVKLRDAGREIIKKLVIIR